MASYFEEHNCEPLKEGETPDHLLHLARQLIDGGYARDLEMEFESVFGKERPPPASKKVVAELPTLHTTQLQEAQGFKCPVCLAEYEEGEPMRKLPCDHCFHPKCILPWLEKTNSCPLCRHELPTDDPRYEEFKKQKGRAAQRKFEQESLHASMFG